jgi:hypothetical protein
MQRGVLARLFHAPSGMNMSRFFLIAGFLLLMAAPGLAQQPDTDPERRAELERRQAGLQIGAWMPTGLPTVTGAEYSVTPFITGFFRRGLDRHLAWESSVSFWMRKQERQTGGITPSRESVKTYIVPLITSLTFYPATGPDAAFEPFLRGGGGLVLGIDDREGTSGGILGVGREGVIFYTGIGLRGGAGLDLRLSPAFGLTAAAQYQWIRFLEGEPGGAATYGGPVVEAGILYRFQY